MRLGRLAARRIPFLLAGSLAAVFLLGLIQGMSPPVAAGEVDSDEATHAAAPSSQVTLVQETNERATAELAQPVQQANSQLKWRSYRTSKSAAKTPAASPTVSRNEPPQVVTVRVGESSMVVWRRPSMPERTVAFESAESAPAKVASKAAPKAAKPMPNDPVNEPLRIVAPAVATPASPVLEPAAAEPAATEPAVPETEPKPAAETETPAVPETPADSAAPAQPATPGQETSPSDTTLPNGTATEGATNGTDSVRTAQQDLDRCPSVADLKKIKDITTNIKPKPPERSPGLRPWKDRAGQVTVEEGEFVDVVDNMVHVKKRDGQTVSIKVSDLSDEDEQYVLGLPPECSLGNEQFQPRNWAAITYTWKASGLCHKPLYFEDVALERYGHSWGPFVQPFVSGAHFFVTVPILPYKMGMEPPCECLYTLGYYRPGSCAPYTIDAFPLSVQGGLWQAGVWTGMIFLIP
ncbi:MAG: SHD1 domain-containing protein [Pirellulales bacterium]